MQISEVMTQSVESTTPEESIQQAAARMRDLDVGSLPVVDKNGRLVGVITDRDIAIRSVASGANPATSVVREAMTPDVVYCYEDQDVADAAELMKDRQIRRLIILDRDNKLAGIVSLGDLAIQTHDESMVGGALETVSAAAPNR